MTLEEKQQVRNRWAFALGAIGRDMAASGLFMNYLMSYVLLTKQLSNAMLLIIAVVMLIARIVEAALDPLMGTVIDFTRTRFGKFKPWLAVGALGTAIVVSVSFSNSWQGRTYILAFMLLYLLFDCFFTMNDIAYWGMLPALSRSSTERNRLSSLSALMAGLGGLVSSALVPLLTVGTFAIGGSAVTAYARVALLFAAALLFSQAITLIFVHEPPVPRARRSDRPGLRPMMALLKRNDELRWNALILFICMATSTLSTTVLPFYFYSSLGYAGIWPLIYTLCGQLAVAAVYVLFNRISLYRTRRELAQVATLLGITGYLALLIVGLLVPNGQAAFKIGLFALLGIPVAVSTGIYLLILQINIANCVEYDELLTGARHEGTIYAVRPLVNKLGLGFGQAVVMLVYMVSGTLTITRGIAHLEQQAGQGRLTTAVKGMRVTQLVATVGYTQQYMLLSCAVLIPLAGLCAMWWLYAHKLQLDEQRFTKIIRQLDQRGKTK